MKNTVQEKRKARIRRHNRVRAKVAGTKEMPRLSVYRSNKSFFVQLIDDNAGNTLVSVGPKEVPKIKTKTDTAKEAGKLIAKKAIEKNIKKVVFDRGGYRFHGRVKAVAEGAKEGGLIF